MAAKNQLAGYKAAHKNMRLMTLKELAVALQAEIDADHPRVDLIMRLVGRYNRMDGARRQREIIGLLSKPGKRDVNAILGHNR